MKPSEEIPPAGKPRLRRVISAPLLVLYGLGTMLGAGIYVLIGEVAGAAGVYAPAAFLLAALIAGLTGLSFADLASRFPKSAGEAVYIAEGFDHDRLSLAAGLLIVASGVVSSGVMMRGFAGYAEAFLTLPDWLVFIAFAVAMGGLAAWGIAQSLAAIAVITVIEAAALLLVIALGVAAPPVETAAPVAGSREAAFGGVIAGAVLAFYAFIGFEDMVNVAEEVKNPRRAMPMAIIIALCATLAVYVGVAWAAVRTTPVALLAGSEAPMTLIMSRLLAAPAGWMSVIAMIAVVNGALIQIVMAARVLYGLSRREMIPVWFGRVSPRTRTPVNATVFVAALVLVSALLLPLATLAQATSFFLLTVFALVNIALIRIKRRGANAYGFNTPRIIPYLGAASAAALALVSLAEMLR